MIQKKLTEITKEDIKKLVDNQVLENKLLEYKSQTPGNSDSEKKEFLADVSAFANTDGGDLIFGISENNENNTINEDFGIALEDPDSEVQRLQQMIKDGIEPRIDVDIRSVDVDEKKYIIIIRIKPNFNGPHRIAFRGYHLFYKRSGNGKYEMDVQELKTAFNKTENIINEIRNFRKTRIFEIKENEGPINLENTENFLVVHIIPLAGILDPIKLQTNEMQKMKDGKLNSSPLYGRAYNVDINMEGICTHNESSSYTQIFRNGTIEGFSSSLVAHKFNEQKSLYITEIENRLIIYIKEKLELLNNLEIKPPYFIFITLVGIKGYIIPLQTTFGKPEEITKKEIHLPEIIINDATDDVPKKLKPVFDMIWNAAGHIESINYTKEGKWEPKS